LSQQRQRRKDNLIDYRENPADSITEVLADLGMMIAQGHIDGGDHEFNGRTLNEYYQMALQQAILSNTHPIEAASLIAPHGTGQTIQLEIVSQNAALRINPSTVNPSSQFLNSLHAGHDVFAIGVSEDRDWVYVGFQRGKGFEYAWTSLINVSSGDLDDLPSLSPEQTNPQRLPDLPILEDWLSLGQGITHETA
jgi:hypothetical protein